MGRIWFEPNSLTGTVGDLLGHKAGLALTHAEVGELLAPDVDFSEAWNDNLEQVVPLRSEEFEALFAVLMERLGRSPRRSPLGPVGTLLHQFSKADAETAQIGNAVFEMWFDLVREQATSRVDTPIDLGPLVERATARFGGAGRAVALMLVEACLAHMDTSPYTEYRLIDWKDRAALADLFQSESLDTPHGKYIDQRFVDFLSVNWAKLGTMNWRKFEALTAEFFHRLGYEVELGPGRNDDGVDVRVWPGRAATAGPPLLLVQCKRTRSDVEKVVVKALWSDIEEEGARAGLVVTTARLSPGAEAVCQARGYPIGQANLQHLREWLRVMRTPRTGIFLGE